MDFGQKGYGLDSKTEGVNGQKVKKHKQIHAMRLACHRRLHLNGMKIGQNHHFDKKGCSSKDKT